MSFFDIVLDFILMDAFEDLENPPASVLAVLRNRWLSDSFKETVGRCPAPRPTLAHISPCGCLAPFPLSLALAPGLGPHPLDPGLPGLGDRSLLWRSLQGAPLLPGAPV